MGYNPVTKQVVDSLSHFLQGFIHPRWCRIPEPSTVGHDLSSLKLTAKAPENGWLENYLPFWGKRPIFRGKLAVSFREGVNKSHSVWTSSVQNRYDIQILLISVYGSLNLGLL